MTVNHSLAVSRLSPTSVAGQPGLAGTGSTSRVHKQSSWALDAEGSRGQQESYQRESGVAALLPSQAKLGAGVLLFQGLRASDLNIYPVNTGALMGHLSASAEGLWAKAAKPEKSWFTGTI